MDMKILIPVLIGLAISVICGVVLTVASRLFAVKEDEKFLNIRDCLPGANCGACGYSGCDGYAKALSSGEIDVTNLCLPGGDSAAKQIADVLGVEAEDVIEKVAYVACNGNCEAAPRKVEYHGPKSCRIANMSYSGDKFCTFSCLGYGDCIAACSQDAISIENGVAKVDPEKCVGCGACTRVCPNKVIHIVDAASRVKVLCSNHDKGAVTRKACANGCIACGKCERTCPNGAIKVEHNLAVIDYEKCTGCGECAEACPVKCIELKKL
ncbi:MAG: RnfABCDGE type electron transport complex subunit B [Clostridia bacterium]|nr:RnfABCDGE type electron transport complex subunit B [Clostridia bacterium]